MFTFFALGLYFTFLAIIKGQFRLSWGHRDESVALAMADSAMDQTLSLIRTGQKVLPLEMPPTGTATPTGVPTEIAIPVSSGSQSATAYAKIDFARDASNKLVRDIEGNLTYRAIVVVDDPSATGTRGKLKVRRGVSVDFNVINFGRYLGYIWSDDQKSLSAFDGPYHCNGNLTFTGGTNSDWNDAFLKTNGNAADPFYDPTYVTAVAGNINMNGHTYYTQNQVLCTGTGAGFNIQTNASSPQGTWFDLAHGAVTVLPPSLPSNVSSVAQVVIDNNLLFNSNVYTLQGTGLTGTGPTTLDSCPMMNAGIAGFSGANQFVPVNLSALASGRGQTIANGNIQDFAGNQCYLGDTDANALANYTAALSSTYGLVIYINGNACIWGQLPTATGAANSNKEVTIIVTGTQVELMGDILYSDSPYATGVEATSNDVDPNYLVDDPHSDSIAIIAPNANIYVDPFYRGSPSYFVNSSATTACAGDMRIDAFQYTAVGYTGGNDWGGPGLAACPGSNCGDQQYIVSNNNGCGVNGNCINIQHFTYHGAISVFGSGFLPSCSGYYRIYDPGIKYNLSPIVPSGTVFHAYQEMVNPPQLP
jgi:hypothetical protein